MVQGSRGPTLGSGGTDGQKTEGDTRRFTEPTGHHSPTPGSIKGTREEPRAASLGRWSQRHPEPERGPVGEDTEFALGTVSLHAQYANERDLKLRGADWVTRVTLRSFSHQRSAGQFSRKRKEGQGHKPEALPSQRGARKKAGLRGDAGARLASEPRDRATLPQTNEGRRHQQTLQRSQEGRGLKTGQALWSRRVPSDS